MTALPDTCLANAVGVASAAHAAVSLEQRPAVAQAPTPSKYVVTPEMARRINARRVNARRAYEERGVLRELGLLDH